MAARDESASTAAAVEMSGTGSGNVRALIFSILAPASFGLHRTFHVRASRRHLAAEGRDAHMDTRPARGALAAVLLGYFVVMLDTTIVNVALPRIGADLDAQVAELQWVADAYTIVFAALLLGAGSACDRMGARRVYVAGLLLFAALSADALWLLQSRCSSPRERCRASVLMPHKS